MSTVVVKSPHISVVWRQCPSAQLTSFCVASSPSIKADTALCCWLSSSRMVPTDISLLHLKILRECYQNVSGLILSGSNFKCDWSQQALSTLSRVITLDARMSKVINSRASLLNSLLSILYNSPSRKSASPIGLYPCTKWNLVNPEEKKIMK